MTLSLNIPVLTTDRLVMRAPCEADFTAEADFYTSDASKFVGGPMPAHRTWRLLATILGHWVMRLRFLGTRRQGDRHVSGPRRLMVPAWLVRTRDRVDPDAKCDWQGIRDRGRSCSPGTCLRRAWLGHGDLADRSGKRSLESRRAPFGCTFRGHV